MILPILALWILIALVRDDLERRVSDAPSRLRPGRRFERTDRYA
jgi:hypothetical protein